MRLKLFLILFLGTFCFIFFLKSHKGVEYSDNGLIEALVKEKFGPLDAEKRLCIMTGIDYIPYALIEIFENITGIKVITDIFDSNEILEAKLLAGGMQCDIVFPTAWPHFARQLKTDIYQKLDKKRIDFSIFDEDILGKLSKQDENNEYSVPYQFGISGIGMSERIIDKALKNAPKNSLAIVFDPTYVKKISKYRISLYESPNEIFPAVLAYLGLNPETENSEDIMKAAEHLKKIRRYISKFTSFGFEDLSSGNACVTLSASGDILRVNRNHKNPDIKFFCPKEGASLWVDVVAIPVGAKHLNNVYAFLKFLFHPMVIARITNETFRANAVVNAKKYVDRDIINNRDIYPDIAIRKKCYIEKPLSPNIEALKTRLLTKIKSTDD
ncbi:MAG: extracellular solute-binding protein [Holosporaceae bacterium]|jgi:putrescine transport system substrate-binding protein|nr:extracellular solute-binding protein [Holosporaceae bacterium]